MRSPALDRPSGQSRQDHVCWTYDDRSARNAAVVAFLDEGRRSGEQLLWVGPDRQAELVEALCDLPHRDALLAEGRLEVRTTSATYSPAGTLDPEAQVQQLRAETEDAVARGRTGLRIAADVTELAGDGATATLMQRYERLVDALFEAMPVMAMCIYSESVSSDVLGPLVALHPVQHRPAADPGVHVAVRGRTVRLTGELDIYGAQDVAHVLADVRDSTDGDVDVDLSSLAFLDVAGARMLAQQADSFAADGRLLTLHGARRHAALCLQLVGLPVQAREG